jgi:hypothetical protein
MPDLELAFQAIQTQLLSEEFKDVLTAIYDEKEDEQPPQFPAEVYTTIKWAPQNFPNAQLGPPRGRNNSQEAMFLDITYETTLFWEVTGTDEERIFTQLSRLVRATQDFYVPRPNLQVEGSSVQIWTGDEDYSPLINQGDGKPFIQAAAVVLFIRLQR